MSKLFLALVISFFLVNISFATDQTSEILSETQKIELEEIVEDPAGYIEGILFRTNKTIEDTKNTAENTARSIKESISFLTKLIDSLNNILEVLTNLFQIQDVSN